MARFLNNYLTHPNKLKKSIKVIFVCLNLNNMPNVQYVCPCVIHKSVHSRGLKMFG